MIYIFSKSFNPIVCNVIDWLKKFDLEFTRINNYIEEFNKINFTIDLNNKKPNHDFIWINKAKAENNKYNEIIYNQLIHEYHQGFFKNLSKRNVLGNTLYLTDVSKYEILRKAKKKGLNIPNTIITNQKSVLEEFSKRQESIITKSCHDIFSINIGNKTYRPYTSKINKSDIHLFDDYFGISMFQENIEKICDIKAFYFNGKFYSQAIFSQKSEKTKIDFRIFSNSNPSRVTTFKLPEEVEIKTKKLLKMLSLEIAVIDFILGQNNKIYFLEINTDGVFDGISLKCNYNIEKLIANYIYEKTKKQPFL